MRKITKLAVAAFYDALPFSWDSTRVEVRRVDTSAITVRRHIEEMEGRGA
jgi:hypothetical protein